MIIDIQYFVNLLYFGHWDILGIYDVKYSIFANRLDIDDRKSILLYLPYQKMNSILDWSIVLKKVIMCLIFRFQHNYRTPPIDFHISWNLEFLDMRAIYGQWDMDRAPKNFHRKTTLNLVSISTPNRFWIPSVVLEKSQFFGKNDCNPLLNKPRS